MNPQELSEADKHLIYGLLLKKKRSGAQERKVLSIVRSSLDLGGKIEAILQLTRAQIPQRPEPPGAETRGAGRGAAAGAAQKARKQNALVVDARSEIARLLKKCSLKREISFVRIGERYDAVHLVTSLRVRLIIVNEVLPTDEEYMRYFDVCRVIEPGIRIIFLGQPAQPVQAGSAFGKNTRFLPKPLNLGRLEECALNLLGAGSDSQE
ncbi:MAG TPA: hypothetical protein VMU36_07490 [Spirochaetia bacterium]|nr:hypothetical protein [Spirochaetia bacterium]